MQDSDVFKADIEIVLDEHLADQWEVGRNLDRQPGELAMDKAQELAEAAGSKGSPVTTVLGTAEEARVVVNASDPDGELAIKEAIEKALVAEGLMVRIQPPNP